jgi:hypothetical protein
MSQNRDQRYATAAAMRDALKGTDEAATLAGNSEAPTVILAPSAATLAASVADTTPTVLKTGETTVVQSAAPAPRRVAGWAIGAAAVILVGVLFGCFYAYQHRTTAPATVAGPENVNSPTAAPSPATNEAASQPAAGGSTEIKKLVIAERPTPANEPAKRNEKPAKSNDKGREKSAKVGSEETPPDEDEDPTMDRVPVVPDAPPNRGGGRRMDVLPKVKNRPDGSQVMTFPNGMRVVTNPNGNKRVFGPAGRPLKRKRQP